jgi:hypothetical protein
MPPPPRPPAGMMFILEGSLIIDIAADIPPLLIGGA